jgi:hypothetical protein
MRGEINEEQAGATRWLSVLILLHGFVIAVPGKAENGGSDRIRSAGHSIRIFSVSATTAVTGASLGSSGAMPG